MNLIHLNPFIALYSYWLVILTNYNLLLGMYMKPEFIFLSMIIPIPYNSNRNINICLQLFIHELSQL
jgi:hypothetical protein